MNEKTAEIISNQEFIREVLSLGTKQEVKDKLLEKGAILSDEEFEQYVYTILSLMRETKNNEEISADELENISAGVSAGKIVKTTGKVIAFPFRAVAYGVGAVIGGVPKGFVDGVCDAWSSWD